MTLDFSLDARGTLDATFDLPSDDSAWGVTQVIDFTMSVFERMGVSMPREAGALLSLDHLRALQQAYGTTGQDAPA